ncbi:hypothetical protein [Effusibacillus dendaii]|uniref:Uncharacterized protein n=1 Tax=Effusibacillus dendaii TaxID=2743772 RepID=A0A7I8DAL1_9BACL|nr:hypothetical protein [Effusibacillus dendaii]BCJ87135.1 hypothetical protein skT53_21200 [Effusibacillus dendaii]
MIEKWKNFLNGSLQVGLLVAAVVIVHLVVWLSVLSYFYNMYLILFLFLFIPIWLFCVGLSFRKQWGQGSLLIGSFFAVFFLSVAFLPSENTTSYHIENVLIMAVLGSLSSMFGSVIGKLIDAWRSGVKKRRERRSTPPSPTSLRM